LGDGDCVNIIRIEHGTVNELAKLFVDTFTGAQVKVGSLILLFSASHLATSGTASYTEAVVRAAKFILSSFGGKVAVRLGVPVLLEGTKDFSLVRSLAEVAAWADGLLASKENVLSSTRRVMLLCIKNSGSGKIIQVQRQLCQLPVSLTSFEKKTFVSDKWADIFESVLPLSSGSEQQIIDSLIAEINKNFSCNLATEIDFLRSVNNPPPGKSTVVVVGASHGRHLAQALETSFDVRTVEMKGWRPNPATVTEAEEQLQAILTSTSNIAAVIYICLDAAAYYACFEDSVIPARQGNDGVYHIDGDLILAPTDMFVRAIKVCIPLFSCHSHPNIKKIVLSPLPRYWTQRCCEDRDHVANLEEADYEQKMFAGLDNFRRTIKDVLFTSGVTNCAVYNSAQLCSGVPGARSTSSEIRDALTILWGDDPVHPSSVCYDALATGIGNILEPEVREAVPSSSSGNNTVERPAKRPKWLDQDAKNTVAPCRGMPRGSWRGPRGSWRGFQRGRGKNRY
jgi:hypothetical protein